MGHGRRVRNRLRGAERLLVEDRVLGQRRVDLELLIERRQRAVEDVVEVLEADFELRLRVDALDVDLDFSEVDMDTGDDLEEIRQLGAKREVCFQLFDVDVDLVDMHLVDVDEDVRVVAGVAALELCAVHLACGARPGRRARAVPAAAATP